MKKLRLLDQARAALRGSALRFARWNNVYPVDKADLEQRFDA